MSDVTQILNAMEEGDPRAADQLLPLVYEELRRLAAQKLSRELRRKRKAICPTCISLRLRCTQRIKVER
jgi:hypothetical protein